MSARCDRCKRIFSHNDALMQHYLNASIHNYCKRCKRDFGTPVALEEHQKKSSSHNFCDQCGNDYFQTSDLMEHIEECHWYCAKCKLFVETGSLLQKHYEKSSAHHYCGPCKMEFNSAGHLNTVSIIRLSSIRNPISLSIISTFVQPAMLTPTSNAQDAPHSFPPSHLW